MLIDRKTIAVVLVALALPVDHGLGPWNPRDVTPARASHSRTPGTVTDIRPRQP